jgi:hypothetical protein
MVAKSQTLSKLRPANMSTAFSAYMTKPSESRYKQTDDGSKTVINRSTVTGFSRNTLNKSLTSDLPKVTEEFKYCGLGYSYSRQGMLVVGNNAVN